MRIWLSLSPLTRGQLSALSKISSCGRRGLTLGRHQCWPPPRTAYFPAKTPSRCKHRYGDVKRSWPSLYMSSRDASTNSAARYGRKVYLALGSNEGDRLANIETACDLVASHPAIELVRTSSLYESTPMYYTGQGKFFNAACEIRTTLSPLQLLDELQDIENQMGRIKTIDKGPRTIDLDILLFEHETIDVERLIVPHKLMHEREFVLRPLADIAPDARIRSVHATKTIAQHLEDLPAYDPSLTALVPIGEDRFLRPQDPSRRTHLMAVFNVTPDSFSDGGKHFAETQGKVGVDALKPSTRYEASIAQIVAQGADILDIGGQSSRPGAADIGADEETSRVLPALEAAQRSTALTLSVDTYRSEVVVKSSESSTTAPHIINDISAGLLDPAMLSVVARQKRTVVLSHMRGTPETMQSASNLEYPAGVVEEVAAELLSRVHAAEAAGIRRWRIILDPGIGFAKRQVQNLAILRALPRLRAWPGLQGIPWLIGTSRKRFIGELLRRPPGRKGIRDVNEREWGTAATVTAAVAGGADIVRVHNVAAMRDVIDVADAIYRAG